MRSTPDTQLIAAVMPDGSIGLLQFVTVERHSGKVAWEREATNETIAAEIARSNLAGAVSWRRIDPADTPQDRYFRAAWKDDGKAITIDMAKARDIHRDRLREARAPQLAALDVDYQRADEAGDQPRKQDIAKRKQALRDVTADPAIEAAKTPDELRAVWPAALW